MKKYYSLYNASYGLTVAYLGQFRTGVAAEEADRNSFTPGLREEAIWILDESELRGLTGSIQNVLTK